MKLHEELLGKYMMVRTLRAGVFAGTVVGISATTEEHSVVKLKDARRIWAWAGANSLSELATYGTNLPDKCKFPCEVDSALLWGVVEMINITDQARESIKNV